MSDSNYPQTRRAAFLVLATAVALMATALRADEIQTGFQERVFNDAHGAHKYTVFIPAGYTPEQKWPVILYLHGASARGTDNRVQIVGGLGTQINARRDTFPFLVVFPQCEERDGRMFSGWEADSEDGLRALRILDDVEREFNVDRRREILTGWSMGGYGAWNLASACPDRWSAVVVVAGNIDLAKAPKLKGVRIWSFHGLADYGVPIEKAREMVEAVRRAGGHPYLTELPGVGHNIGHVVYSEDALYAWMLNPEQAPVSESFVRNASRSPTKAEMGRDFEFPFVPAVEIPNAFYVRFDPSVLESIAYAVPALVPETALSGATANVHEVSRGAMTQFDVQLSGLSYHGELEQMRFTTRADGWVALQLGLRNVTFRVAQTSVTGLLTSATAGPMDIVVGQREPLWITVQVRPTVEDRRLRLELGNVDVQIQNDNWYVTTPSVEGHGLPFLRSRVADGVSQKMVNDAYGRKHEIESQIKGAMPQLVARLEAKLQESFSTPRIIGSKLPGPTYLPRFVVWPEKIKVDESGLAMFMGIAISRPGLNPPQQPPHVMTVPPVDFDQFPQVKGLQLAISGNLCEGLTEACTNAPMTSADVRELGVRKFAELSDRATMTKIIPDLARFGDQLQIRANFELAGPVRFQGAPSSALAAATPVAKPVALMHLEMTDLRTVVQIKTSPDQRTWQNCAEFDVQMDYLARLSIGKPEFDRRTTVTEMLSDPHVTATARFAAGYRAINPTLRQTEVARIFAAGWKEEGPTQFLHGLCRECQAKDLELGSARVRPDAVTWRNPYIVLEYRVPCTRITNASQEPVEYQVRGPLSDWGGTYVLPAGKSHDFHVPYAMTLRQRDDADARPVPMGSLFLIGPTSATAAIATEQQSSHAGQPVSGSEIAWRHATGR